MVRRAFRRKNTGAKVNWGRVVHSVSGCHVHIAVPKEALEYLPPIWFQARVNLNLWIVMGGLIFNSSGSESNSWLRQPEPTSNRSSRSSVPSSSDLAGMWEGPKSTIILIDDLNQNLCLKTFVPPSAQHGSGSDFEPFKDHEYGIYVATSDSTITSRSLFKHFNRKLSNGNGSDNGGGFIKQ